jgi:hypothetical protein
MIDLWEVFAPRPTLYIWEYSYESAEYNSTSLKSITSNNMSSLIYD